MDPTRSMLKHAGMRNSFWADAIHVADYIKNRLATGALQDTTPFEAWHGIRKKPDLSHLRVFGYLAYARTSPVLRNTLDDRAKKAVLIGHTPTSQQYLLYDIASKREFLARDIQFNEGRLYSELLGSDSQGSASTVTFEIPESTASSVPSKSSAATSPVATTSTKTESKTERTAPPVTAATSTESEDEASPHLQLEATVQPAQAASPHEAASPPQQDPFRLRPPFRRQPLQFVAVPANGLIPGLQYSGRPTVQTGAQTIDRNGPRMLAPGPASS
jgi:hypothetical protein